MLLFLFTPSYHNHHCHRHLQNQKNQKTHKRLHVQRRVEVASELHAPGHHAAVVVDGYIIRLQPALRHLVGVADDERRQPERVAALGHFRGRALADAET